MALNQQIHLKAMEGKYTLLTYSSQFDCVSTTAVQAQLNCWFKTANSHLCSMTVGL
jgi:hypothetical protein